MSPCKLILATVLAGVLITPVLAQNPPSTLPPLQRQKNAPTTHPRQEPCWQVAGISKSALEQRRALAQQAHQEIESVCANSSLSIQQKHEQIRAIHEREKQQVEALITPQQQQAMKACQQSRGHGGGHRGFGGGGRGMGPCGEMPSAIPGTRGTTPPTKGSPPTVDKEEED